MNLNIGDIFLYPHHGSVTVTKLTTRMFNDLPTEYVQFEVAQNGLSIEIPIAKAESIGVRNAINNDEVGRVFDILRGPTVDDPSNWSRRFKANQEKLTVGGIFTVSEVIRDLMTRSQVKPLSAGEKRQLEHAMQLVISELVLAMKSDPDETRRRIEAIYEPRPPLRRRLSQSENTIGSSPERKFGAAADFVCQFAACRDSSVGVEISCCRRGFRVTLFPIRPRT